MFPKVAKLFSSSEVIDQFEFIKRLEDGQFKVVSFDVFDTLVARFISSPEDIFYLLEKRARDDLGVRLPIAAMRGDAIRKIRNFASQEEPTNKEVSSSEVYKYIELHYAVDRRLCEALHHLERQIELELSTPRPAGLKLFQAAVKSRAMVIITSDTYYDEEHLKLVLEKCGVVGYHRLFVSSAGQRTKSAGTIFPAIFAQLATHIPALRPHDICHIGDNETNDVANPKSAGWQVYHLPNPIDRLKHHPLYGRNGFDRLSKFPAPFRMIVAALAYKMFEEPEADLHEKSLFGGDAYNIGFMAAGVLNLGLAHWVAREVRMRKSLGPINIVHFLARDGFLPIRFFNEVSRLTSLDVKSNYLVASRRVLYPAQIDSATDIITAALKHPIKPHQPVEALYKTRMSWSSTAKVVLAEFNDRRLSTKERHKESYLSAVAAHGQEVVDEAEAAKQRLRQVYGPDIDRDDAIFFDLGYHGTTQKLFSKLFDRDYDFLYVLAEPSLLQVTEERGRFSSFLSVPTGSYVRKPVVTAVVEAMICASGPSAVGVSIENGKTKVEYETQPGWGAAGVLTLNEIHEGALDFLDWMLVGFGNNLRYFALEPALAYFFVNLLLRNGTAEDRQVFSSIVYDNSITGEIDSLASKRYWLSKQ
ncbi:HAD superfamily hydrolase protein (plasmid) [Sinorhizobium fredii]|uniref:HAD superfamily hydrolase protein n=2 Tax=Rhizobium fredii TaxID=380 RepID=A0A2L0HHE8_RHIFR|nr:HAD superfamily hydrolase protein [Sinorhizobium fredii]